MKMFKKILFLVFLSFQTFTYAQLGFCTGSSGAPIFFENFGSGTNYGPALPAGTTSYTYVNSGFPQDGQYTLYYRTNLIPNSTNWLYSLDHTPDTDPYGVNGKCLIVNASHSPDQFYKKTVTGLCSNTTFEFSAWLLNILNTSTNGYPINVTFEIWDSTDTILLKSGGTGNISNTSSPVWNQFGLVFTMPVGETIVILKMRNNGVGGNGNDLAIDDIMFRACGEFSSISNVGNSQNFVSICQNETLTDNLIQVTTTGTATNVYQWQQSSDNINFTDIAGETATTHSIPTNITATTYYRVKVARDVANLNNSFCTTLSEIFTVNVNSLPNAPVSNGNQSLCSNQNTSLNVTVNSNESVNWYDAPTNGNLLQANSLTFIPTTAGTYYAEAYNLTTSCKSNTRTVVTLSPLTTITATGNTTICSGETTAINLVCSDTNATINWTVNSSDVQGFSNGTGNTIAQSLTYSGNTTGTVIYTITPIKNGCEGMPETVTISVSPQQNITLTFPTIPTSYCLNATASTLPLTSSNTSPINGNWTPSTIDTSTLGTTIYTFNPQTTSCQSIQPYQISITVGNNFISDFADNLSFCSGSNPPQLNTTSPNGISGSWNPTSINNMVSGSYTFTPNANQCAVNQTINVTILEPTLTSLSYKTSGAFSENQTITILAFSTGNYMYQLDNSSFQNSNVFNNVLSGTHTINVIDLSGCSQPLSQEIIIVNYPRFFTPNGDGFNDFWNISGSNSIGNPTVSIFNRYGKLIKQISSNSNGWDGSFNGKSLPADDYWFTIDFVENNIPRIFKSHFSLSR